MTEPSDDILALCQDLPEVTFQPGHQLLTEDQPGGQLFVLVRGTLTVSKKGAAVARIQEPGAIFGEMSALLDLPVSATVTADTQVTARLCRTPLQFIGATPQFAVHTARLLASRLHNATTYLADLKLQFEDRSDHFGMMDQILDAMVEQQPRARRMRNRDDDPRV